MKAGKKAGSAIFAGLLMASAGVASAQVIRLHDAADYQGANVDIINEVSDLSSVGFSSRAKSATVLGGAWLACRAPYLSGPCVVVREPASNFGMFGMSNAIQSVTPLPAVITYEHGTVFSRDSLGNVIFYRPTGETSVTPIGSTSPPPPAPTPNYGNSSNSGPAYTPSAPASGVGADNYKGPRYPSIILYRDADFEGASFGTDRDVRNLWRDNFDNATSSIEILNGEWEVCENSDYKGKCVILDSDESRLWSLQLDNRISSIRQRPDGTKRRQERQERERIEREERELRQAMNTMDFVIYEHGDFGGRGLPTNGTVNNLGDINDQGSSIRVRKGRWEVCEHGNLQGRCVEVSSDVRNLNTLGMNDRISSVKRLD